MSLWRVGCRGRRTCSLGRRLSGANYTTLACAKRLIPLGYKQRELLQVIGERRRLWVCHDSSAVVVVVVVVVEPGLGRGR